MTTELKPPPITRDQIDALITATVDRAEGYTTEEHEAAEVVLRELLAIALEARDLQWQARVAELERDAARLREALVEYQAAQAMPKYGDYSGFVWPKIEMRKPGETAWGWICEKHGLGYQGGCICCQDEYERHRNQKDAEARYARDDTLKAADIKARAALSSEGKGAEG